MKGSAVVQGLKSLASTLHPQLPLSSRESQRLLTALTSSFQSQLDKAYPRHVGSDESQLKSANGSTISTLNRSHDASSAALADRHLAAVLTNPLLLSGAASTRNALTYDTAKIELAHHSTKDPISLLEDYHQKDAATIAIAAICLETFAKTLEDLSETDRQGRIAQFAAGKRVLLWLWLSGSWRSAPQNIHALNRESRLLKTLVPLVIREGAETFLWDWFKMDVAIAVPIAPAGKEPGQLPDSRQYWWKGRLLRAIIAAKIDLDGLQSPNAALDAILKADAIRREAVAKNSEDTHKFPIFGAATFLCQYFWRSSGWESSVDTALFDTFTSRLGLLAKPGFTRDWQLAKLHLKHPSRPSPEQALELLRRLYDPSSARYTERARQIFERPDNGKALHLNYVFMLETAAQLRAGARTEDAAWVLALIPRVYPELAHFTEADMQRLKEGISPSSVATHGAQSATEGDIPILPLAGVHS